MLEWRTVNRQDGCICEATEQLPGVTEPTQYSVWRRPGLVGAGECYHLQIHGSWRNQDYPTLEAAKDGAEAHVIALSR